MKENFASNIAQSSSKEVGIIIIIILMKNCHRTYCDKNQSSKTAMFALL
jgi:hypothetical protein